MQTAEIESESVEEKLNGFLKENYKFPSGNIKDISQFIQEDPELEKIIRDLPEIISRELSFTHITIDFMKEYETDEKILEIIIHCPLAEEMRFQKEDMISDGIIDSYSKTEHEFIILVES